LLRRRQQRAGASGRNKAEARVSRVLAQALNESCFCASLDSAGLARSFAQASGDPDFTADLNATRPHLIADSPVFLPKADFDAMADIVRAVGAATRLGPYREAVLSQAPIVAQRDFGPHGAFMGYDFHVTEEGPKLIEINTNAGGAFLNAFIARAQRVCCSALAPSLAESFDGAVVAMFEREWRLQRGGGRPGRIAIVDDAPEQQYLYPEFVLARDLLARAGFEVVIADARALRYEDGALRYGGEVVDLVYNRLVDFTLNETAHAALREAYRADAVVLTPNPHNHTLVADKRNLTLLSDHERLGAWGLEAEHVGHLRALPRAHQVTSCNADRLWNERRRYFFKPGAGYGSKAVYRGDKLTKNVWRQILGGGYIAQERAEPSERSVRVGGDTRSCKLDVRLFTYDGRPLLSAARLYQGQTTNFRTPGGGFAPVLVV
jgi:hypothetical protein